MTPSTITSPIIRLLREAGKVTPAQVEHAARVQAKLTTFQPLLKILKDLKSITDQDVKEILRASSSPIRIGDLLVELGHISPDDLDSAIRLQRESDSQEKLGQVLVRHNFIEEQTFIEVLSIQMGYPFIEPGLNNIDKARCVKIPKALMTTHGFVPIKSDDGSIRVAFADPLDQEALQVARRFLGTGIVPSIAQGRSIRKTVELLAEKQSSRTLAVDNTTVVGTVNSIILGAIKNNASDIHIEPMEDRLQVRFREDGVLNHFKDFPKEIIPALTSRLKILCQADITEKRRHQGGRILFEYDEGQLDLRLSFFITIHGEKIVLRLLNRKQELFDLQSIGMTPRMLSRFLEDAVYHPSGVVLVTGPTGSGKTSTIYSCIHALKSPQVSIITAEEPVEYVIEGVAQCSIDPKIDLTFEETLRHIVRQDPDVIVIGEIRDAYSAEVAVQAALTGHKVLSTFHTEDSIGGLIRLLNMDIAPFLVSSTVVSVLAQRLLRRVCPHCAVDAKPTPVQLQRLRCTVNDLAGASFKKGRGCRMCKQSGYKGRIGVFELLVLDERVRTAILEQKTSYDIRTISIHHSGLMTLLEDGLVKAAMGSTTVDEILRCLPIFSPPRPLAELRRLAGI
ncbi:type II secretion system protein E [Desulfobulbus propionicus DSM 2032]|uniref:Type II secretion system protein E n=1 Tax=Desulfobulbus propionicus (strain ATCC 33891 / DSM 2032 / VKM B-1956 / 1pr3) TaxID=577650 RepID=A0A7U3YIV9_DESPD|nr:GspE/PulE family protein [Desulfobulbus propionicus]ADW16229.1 type II secretion system protein E [Desulfobulbus propionicus DSM 2032]